MLNAHSNQPCPDYQKGPDLLLGVEPLSATPLLRVLRLQSLKFFPQVANQLFGSVPLRLLLLQLQLQGPHTFLALMGLPTSTSDMTSIIHRTNRSKLFSVKLDRPTDTEYDYYYCLVTRKRE